MKRVALLLVMLLMLTACGAPADQPMPQVPGDTPAAGQQEAAAPSAEPELPKPQPDSVHVQEESAAKPDTVSEKTDDFPEKTDTPSATEPAPSDELETGKSTADAPRTCTFSIRCDSILVNMENLNPDKTDLIPADGVILAPREVTFNEGESVFNLLQRETKRNRIHMEFSSTPAFESAYIEGIANLYEFDCGPLSGWIYFVNGESVGYGCSRYTVQPGDRIEWVYTCDLGRDVGAGVAAQEYFDAARQTE